MKTTKISLAALQGKLSRTEMKNIMAGTGTGYPRVDACIGKSEGNSCSYNLPGYGSYSGTCQWVPFSGQGLFCFTGYNW